MKRRSIKWNGTSMDHRCARLQHQVAQASAWLAVVIVGGAFVAIPAAAQSDGAAPAKPQAVPAIARILPPPGMALEPAVQQELTERESQLRDRLAALNPARITPDDHADVEIYLKAVRLALHHGEFYAKKDIDTARKLLDQAEERLKALEEGKRPWDEQRGPVVRGYRSKLDGSAQPYGLVIPEKLELK